MRTLIDKIKKYIKIAAEFLLNPRLLLCLGLGWLITNGWSYILFAIAAVMNIKWLMGIAGAYLTFLWLPISPEKIVTVALAIFFLKKFFPHDQRTLGRLYELRDKVRVALRRNKTQVDK